MTGPLLDEPQCSGNNPIHGARRGSCVTVEGSSDLKSYDMKKRRISCFLMGCIKKGFTTFFTIEALIDDYRESKSPLFLTLNPLIHFLISVLIYLTKNSAACFITSDSEQAWHDKTSWDSHLIPIFSHAVKGFARHL